jgi:basic membrane protein A
MISLPKRLKGLPSALFLLAFGVAACGGAATTAAPAPTEAPAPTTAPAEPVKVALVMIGLVTGDPWNYRAVEGLERAKNELGVETAVTENVAFADLESVLRNYASSGFDLVIGHNAPWGEPAMAIAGDFPETFFVVNANRVSNGENVASVNPLFTQNGYLSGALAALMSESGTVGAITGFDYASTDINNFWRGAKETKPDIEVLVGFTGSWDDPAAGKEQALSMVESGADVLANKAGGSGAGILEAALEKDVWFINDTISCADAAPDNCLAATATAYEDQVFRIVQMFVNGELEPKVYDWGISEGIVDLAPIHADVPQDVRDQVADLRQQMVDGELVVPDVVEPLWTGQ